jgi:hypothetical protein
VTAAERLAAAHDRWCFARAFPRSAGEYRRAVRLLAEFDRRVARHRDALANSGIAGTLYSYPFNHAMARWLSGRYGRAVEVDWRAYRRHTWDEIAALLSLAVAWAENEGVDDDDVPSWEWVRLAKRGDRRTDLAWLLDLLHRRGYPPQLERHLYDGLNLPLRWDLARSSRDSITHLALPVRRVFYHRRLLRDRPADFAAAVRRPIAPLEPLSAARADRIIAVARAALSTREREFHAIVFANRREVYRVEAGRGLEIYIMGIEREQRLTLESLFGGLFVKNGVPIGYASGVMLLDRVDIAVNVFPTYRGGESPFMFERFAAVFHHHFGARKLLMRRYQVGWQNPEGLASGSFWFYWKLGFRPVDARVREEAEKEAWRLERREGARSSEAKLRRLSRSDMVLCTDGSRAEEFRDPDLKRIGFAVTRLIETRYGGDRDRAVADLTRRVATTLGVPSVPTRIVPVVALIPDLRRWTTEERRALAALLRAKEAPRERPFVLALQRHGRFAAWLSRRFGG